MWKSLSLSLFSSPCFLGYHEKRLRKNCEEKLSEFPFYTRPAHFLSRWRNSWESESKASRRRATKIFKGMMGDERVYVGQALACCYHPRALCFIYTFTWQKLKIRQVGSCSLSPFSLSLCYFYENRAYFIHIFTEITRSPPCVSLWFDYDLRHANNFLSLTRRLSHSLARCVGSHFCASLDFSFVPFYCF